MPDEKGDKKGSGDEKPNEREPKERRDEQRSKFVTEELENPFIWRGMD